ncbi:MAG: polyprenyl synthetase family protein [Alphaproteobacteria bacterium]|nr:polyprenyl synthetase family protein [Alphaproteobacteria bacterium]MBV9370795.1 polyprenyl synthetase family protein [Alphaproteobacteria bacterium]MBV9900125.1 polyprenyl synthetase family protein [Alphaproteobacteria bacterium]
MKTAEPQAAEVALGPSLARAAAEIDSLFEALLPDPPDPRRRLFQAMRHAAIGGGKRLRPALCLASADLFGVPRARAFRAGLAVECVHIHSLIHDDLPCMDDDDLRRGKPTVHRAYDEATAVLAGDALLALAFGILADPLTHSDGAVRAELSGELSRAAGAWGMAGGQMLDLLSSAERESLDTVTSMQRLKTGALIGWCVEAGAILGHAPADARTSLRGYAQCLGLAFQIADDLLDREGDERVVGKRLRKDEQAGRVTFVTLLGADRARRQADLLVEQAAEHLRGFGEDARLLDAIARFCVSRRR